MMCGSVVAWGSKLQSTIALSTEEAEYMAICAAAQEALFLRQLLANLNLELPGATRMLEDDVGCIALATSPMTTGKTTHIDIRYHFIREMVKGRTTEVQYCPTEEMIADALTKFTLPKTLHLRHVGRMLSEAYEPPPI